MSWLKEMLKKSKFQKISNFKNISGVRSSSKFLTGEITKPTGDKMKILRGESQTHTHTHTHTHKHTHTYIYVV